MVNSQTSKLILILALLLSVSIIGFAQDDNRVVINYPNFSDISDITLSGHARYYGNPVYYGGQRVMRLTRSTYSQAGGAFLTEAISLHDGASFSTYFTFQITSNGGMHDYSGYGADGLVFVVQTRSNQYGGAGGGIGYQGIQNSMGIEFDTWRNGWDRGNGNHVGINFNGNITSVQQYNIGTLMNNSQIWHAWVDYDGENQVLQVRIARTEDRPENPIMSRNVNLPYYLGQEDAYVGFTSGTGGAYGNHDIRSWVFINEFIPIEEPEFPLIGVTPESLDFGGIDVESSSDLTLEVANDGTADLTVSNIAVDGDGFSIDFGGQFVLTPGNHQDITVTFAPDAGCDFAGTVTITSDDPNNGTVTVALAGVGLEPDITLSTNALDFGDVLVGENGELTFQIGNDGNADLVVSNISVGDVFATDFGGSFAVAPGNFHTVTVTFTPETYTDYTESVTIASNDNEDPVVAVALAGLGLAPDITLSDDELDFGEAEFWRSAVLTFDIGNIGNIDLNVSDIYVDGDDFEVNSDGGLTIAVDGSVTLTVTYSANTVGNVGGEIIIVSDDPDEDEVTIDLSATCVWVSAIDLLPRLCEYVNDLKDARILNRGQANSLCVKTRNAARRLEREQVHTALNILNAYINQVNCFIEEEVLPEENGQWLIFEANFIINLLEEFGIDGSGFALTNALPSEVTLSSAYPNP
ncbi:MAG: choice-of-anchor D domain-containing protein, partial [Calditrichaeota bacterium]|nr:choice-of-anchor D domain-containing protein [Calditrichota bacterium]